MTTINDPTLAGQKASDKLCFGRAGRYAVAAMHTRFDAITWFVWDAEKPEDDGTPSIIRQADTLEAAIAGLENPSDYII